MELEDLLDHKDALSWSRYFGEPALAAVSLTGSMAANPASSTMTMPRMPQH